MTTLPPKESRNVTRTAIVYLGGAWVFIEAFNFLIDKYGFDAKWIDITILIVIFGLPAVIIHSLFYHKFSRNAVLLHALNVVLAFGVIGYLQFNPDSFHPTELRLLNFKNSQKTAAESIRSIAILPFANYTGNTEKDFLSSGIHDALISQMGQIGAVRMISKTSTLAYANSDKTIQQIASELDVDGVIEGSLLVADDVIRLQLKLISAFPEELQIWTRTYDASMNDLLNVYSDMTKNIAEEINITISPSENRLITKNKTVHPDAYEAYLKGKYSMGMLSKDGIEAAMGHFQRAIQIDPEFAQAYGGLGGIWAFLKQMDIVTTEQANPNIVSNLSKAMELDSTLADVHYWEAIKKVWTDFDWNGGERTFKKALSLNHNFSEARGLYSNFLMCMSRFDEAREEMDKALNVDPNNPFIMTLDGTLYTFNGSPQAAVDRLIPIQQAMPGNPLANLNLFLSYYQLGKDDQCFEQFKMKMQMEGHEDIIPAVDETYKKDGFKKTMLKAAQMLENKENSLLTAQTMIFLYAMAEEEDKTMDWVEKGYIRRDSDIPFIKVMPPLLKYQKNQRFIEVAKLLNL